MPTFINFSAYRFLPLTDLKPLRARLLARTKELNLRGTILLSTEGINLFIAGAPAAMDEMLLQLRAIPGLHDLSPKVSPSDHQPFTRMLVRIKKEIIAFGVPEIDPGKRTSPKLKAAELKRWLDEGRPVTLLDTRNDYEVKLGTFRNAVQLDIQHFKQFPAAVEKLPTDWKQQPIVMFCTGGIRCEKAGPFMERKGFEQIFQLDGGILKYFEEVGGDHYDGDCFVFDQRVGVDPSLAETENTQCFRCLTPLTAEDQDDPRYVPGQSCQYCYKTGHERMAETIATREAAIARATNPLPGKAEYDNYRPLTVTEAHEGLTLLDFLCTVFQQTSREEWQALIEAGQFLDGERRVLAADEKLHAGARYVRLLAATSEPDVAADIRVLYEDESLVVVNKPAPLPLHPSGRYNRNTLQNILNLVYAPQKVRPAHRLDANTSGVVVLARSRHFAGIVQPQFARGEVEKVYLARLQGHPPQDHFICDAPISDTAGELGSRVVDEAGSPARTEFTVFRRDADGTSLVEARPITGRTNQIRVHAWQLGWPIVGEQTYLPGGQLGTTQTHAVHDLPLCLHSWKLTLTHPLTRERMAFEAAPPAWTKSTPA
jgi:UPF0176 protein